MLTILVLAFCNYAGISITKYASSMHRVVVTAGRPLCIWLVAYFLNWEGFITIQFIGYIVCVCGILLYYEVIKQEHVFKEKQEEITDSNEKLV